MRYYFGFLFTSVPVSHAQVFSGGKINLKPAPKTQPQAQGGIAGTWVLKNVALSSGATLTDGMRASLENTRLTVEGDSNGKITFDMTNLLNDPGKPVVKCQVSTTSPFTVVHLEGEAFVRVGTGAETPSPKCSPYPTQVKPVTPYDFMFDVAGDTLTIFDAGAADGVIIYTYARTKPGLIQFKNPLSR